MGFGALRNLIRPLSRTLTSQISAASTTPFSAVFPSPSFVYGGGSPLKQLQWLPLSIHLHSLTDTRFPKRRPSDKPRRKRASLRPSGLILFLTLLMKIYLLCYHRMVKGDLIKVCILLSSLISSFRLIIECVLYAGHVSFLSLGNELWAISIRLSLLHDILKSSWMIEILIIQGHMLGFSIHQACQYPLLDPTMGVLKEGTRRNEWGSAVPLYWCVFWVSFCCPLWHCYIIFRESWLLWFIYVN